MSSKQEREIRKELSKVHTRINPDGSFEKYYLSPLEIEQIIRETMDLKRQLAENPTLEPQPKTEPEPEKPKREKIVFLTESKTLMVFKSEKSEFVLPTPQWSYVEETELEGLSIVVAKNSKGEKLYFKKMQSTKFGFELEPLNKSELKKLKITECANLDSKYMVQETETEENGKNDEAKFDVTDIEAMKKAKKIAEDRIKALEGSDSSSEPKIEPTLDSKKVQVVKQFGDVKALDCETVEQLREFVTEKVRKASEISLRQTKTEHGDTALLTDSQITGISPKAEDENKHKLPTDLEAKIVATKYSDVDPEFWEAESMEALMGALKIASKDSTNPQQQRAKEVLSRLYRKATKQSNAWELEGNVTELGKSDNNSTKKKPYFRKIEGENENE